jgi:hypothetical protein
LLTLIVCDDPWPSVPVSKVWPSSAVTLCGALSSLVTADRRAQRARRQRR